MVSAPPAEPTIVDLVDGLGGPVIGTAAIRPDGSLRAVVTDPAAAERLRYVLARERMSLGYQAGAAVIEPWPIRSPDEP